MALSRIQAVVACGLMVVALAVGRAQSPPVGTEQTQTPPATTGQPPVFRSLVELVTTDVIVRDSSGQFVADLKPEEFEIFEDGVPQKLVSMILVHGGRLYNAVEPPPPPVQEGIILPAQRPVSDTAGRIFLIFIDDLHLDFRNTPRIRQLLQQVSDELIHPGDMFGVLSTGPSSVTINLTYDRRRLEEAISKVTGNALTPDDIISGMDTADGPAELQYRARVAFSTALDLMRNLEQVHNRRKAVIYVSNGYDFNPFFNTRACAGDSPFLSANYRCGADVYPSTETSDGTFSIYNPYEDSARQSQQFADLELGWNLTEMTDAANRANATIYTIDPRGLVAGPEMDQQVDPTEWAHYVQNSIDSLRVIADLTGGIAVVNQNEYDKALERIDAETSDYYVIGYYSTNVDPTIPTRRLAVEVTRPDVTVWSRTLYTR